MGIPAPAGVSASGLPPAGDQANAVVSGTFAAVGPGKPFAFRGPMNLAIWPSVVTALTTTAGTGAISVASATGLAVGSSINSVNLPRGSTILTLVGTDGTIALPTLTLPGITSTVADEISGLPRTAGLLGSQVAGPGIPAGTTVVAIRAPAVAPTQGIGGAAGHPGSPGTVQISALPTSASAINQPVPFEFSLTSQAITTGVDAAASFTDAALAYSGTVQLERSFDGGATWVLCNVGGSGALAQYSAGTPVSFTFGEPEKEVLYRLNCIAYTSGAINYRISQTGGAAESLAIGPLSSG